MDNPFTRVLITEDGEIYRGRGFGGSSRRVLELVFNTSMAGYQEIISDPSYKEQCVVMTYPLIGNYGLAEDDYEAALPHAGALAVREYNDFPSNFRSTGTLGRLMEEFDIPGISGIDTRRLTRSIRDKGSRRCIIAESTLDVAEGLEIIQNTPLPHTQVKDVSPAAAASYGSPDALYRVAVIDCGMKENIRRTLVGHGAFVTSFPYDTPAAEILRSAPDGILVSNGPGDPRDIPVTAETVRELSGRLPMLGICLGHQLISLASGASIYKLKFGHRGGNHPVKNLLTGGIEITSQNHSYAVVREGLETLGITLSHVNLLDGTVEGIVIPQKKILTVQYHPESAPGPVDSGYIFDEFFESMKSAKS